MPRDPDKQREYQRRYKERHRGEIRERQRLAYHADPSKRERHREWAQRNPEPIRARARAYQRKRRAELRVAVFDHYGWVCACCRSADQPTIDHINGGGGEHRKRIGRTALHSWLVRNGFPKGFQTLCHPCNRSKGDGERCRAAHLPE